MTYCVLEYQNRDTRFHCQVSKNKAALLKAGLVDFIRV